MQHTSFRGTHHTPASKGCLTGGVGGGGRTLEVVPVIGASRALRERRREAAQAPCASGRSCLWHGEGREGK